MGTRIRLVAIFVLLASAFATTLSGAAQNGPQYDPHQFEFATDEFQEVWDRTDRPVQEGATERTWLWGPGANTPLISEPYEEADDGERVVQYTDKSRMEMPWNDDVDQGSPWFITQGLLAYELMSGRVQVGDAAFEDAFPSEIQVAGDPNSAGPTYRTMGQAMNNDPRSEGNVIVDVITESGYIFQNPVLADVYGVTDDYWIEQTGFYIADVFWSFMISSGPVYEDGILQTGQVFESPFYAVGFPITPAYWSWVKVNNVEQNVLVQCFERRCLTYTPDNPSAWQVESGNVGQHYFEWRYNQVGQPAPPDDDDDDADDGVDDGEPTVEPASFSVSPEVSTNLVGSTHTITVTVEGTDDEPFQGAGVTASVTDGPHDGTDLTAASTTTDVDGQVQLSYTGTEDGTDIITVTVEGIDDPQTVTKIWADYVIELDPDDADNMVGSDYTLLATLLDAEGEIDLADDDSVSVSISRDGDDFEEFDTSTNDDEDYDRLEISYTGPTEPAEDTITVTVTIDVGGEDEEITASTTKTWVPYTLDLDPEDAENTVGDPYTLTVTLEDLDGAVEIDSLDMVEVDISREDVDGTAEFTNFTVNINAEGEAEVEYDLSPTQTAVDAITVTVTVETDAGDIDVTAETTKTWMAGPPDNVELRIELEPAGTDVADDDEVSVDNNVTLIAMVTDLHGNEVSGVDVQFESDQQGTLGTPVVTDGAGEAVLENHNHEVAEDEEITATEQVNNNDSERTIEWVAGAATSLTLQLWDHPHHDQSHVNPIGHPDYGRHHVVALVEDQHDNPVPGVSVTFSLTEGDPNDPLAGVYGVFETNEPWPITFDETDGNTNAGGEIGFLYEGDNVGQDTIIAEVTGSQDQGENLDLMDTSDKLWCSAVVVDGEIIQDAVEAASAGDTICVGAGTYEEQILITLDLTLLGQPGATIEAPEELDVYEIDGYSNLQLPIVAAIGGTVEPSPEPGVDFDVSGSDTIDVNISGLTVDGGNEVDRGSGRTSGIAYRNANGTISGNTVERMLGYTDETVGIKMLGDSEVTVSENTVTDYGRVGIAATNSSTGPSANVSVLNNIVTGPGVPTDRATNGIQISGAATGEVIGNTVTRNIYEGTQSGWASGGIMISQASDVTVDDNIVTGNEHGIQVAAGSNVSITNNNVSDNHSVGVHISGEGESITITNNTVTSNLFGLFAHSSANATGLTVHSNNFSENTVGARNSSTVGWELNVTNNWWGHEDGPTHASNPDGEGDLIDGAGAVVLLPFAEEPF